MGDKNKNEGWFVWYFGILPIPRVERVIYSMATVAFIMIVIYQLPVFSRLPVLYKLSEETSVLCLHMFQWMCTLTNTFLETVLIFAELSGRWFSHEIQQTIEKNINPN